MTGPPVGGGGGGISSERRGRLKPPLDTDGRGAGRIGAPAAAAEEEEEAALGMAAVPLVPVAGWELAAATAEATMPTPPTPPGGTGGPRDGSAEAAARGCRRCVVARLLLLAPAAAAV